MESDGGDEIGFKAFPGCQLANFHNALLLSLPGGTLSARVNCYSGNLF
jgi:hypothetical protein